MRSRLNHSKWKDELAADPDREFLLEGVTEGFHIIEPEGNLLSAEMPNHRSATDPQVRPYVEELILNEINSGNYIMCNSKPNIVSAIGAVPKSDGGYRLIHDCSLPKVGALNNYAPEMDKYSYETVDQAVSLLKPGYYMAKVDIKSSYRHVPIHPKSQRATGLSWVFEDGTKQYFYDAKLPFGARASPTIFHRISQSVKRMMARRGFDLVVAFQDDFLIIGKTYAECLEAWLILIDLLLGLGFQLSQKKSVGPTTCLVFLGIQLDTVSCQCSLPREKLEDIQTVTASFLQKRRASRRQLQSLAGKLNFAAKVVRGGRTFLRRILNCIARLRRPDHKAIIPAAAREDIKWWHTFLKDFNGVVSFVDHSNFATIMTDACSMGGGGFCNGDWFYVNWELDIPHMASVPINYKEAVTAAYAVIRWAPVLQNRNVYVYVDNQCAASIINKCASKEDSVMSILRQMFWTVAENNCSVKALCSWKVSHYC